MVVNTCGSVSAFNLPDSVIVFYFFYKPKHADTNLKLAPCPVRSVAAATFAFYLADPISSIHEFAPIETRIYTKRFSSCFYLLKFVTIRAIRVTADPLRTSGADLQKISELWPPLPLVVHMKTYYWLNRNRVLSRLRLGGGETFIPAPSHLRNSVNRVPWRPGFILLPLLLACFALSPTAQGQLSPPPGGGYPNDNTALGQDALYNLDISQGASNTAVGFDALFTNNDGTENTALGFSALYSNTTGYYNTANGSQALFSNTTGYENTANGEGALYFNTTGNGNTANGVSALISNIDGSYNTANGAGALGSNTSGSENTANGEVALISNTTGFGNTANGVDALYSNTGGNFNIALGWQAGFNLTTGGNNIDIGNLGLDGESNTIRIGGDIGQGYGSQTATFIAGIYGVDKSGGSPVFIDANGQLGTGSALPGPTWPNRVHWTHGAPWRDWCTRHKWN